MLVYDKDGQEQTLAWLFDRYGAVELHELEYGAYAVHSVHESADKGVHAACVIEVWVMDANNEPIEEVDVVFYWPDAPVDESLGWKGRGVLGKTDHLGHVAFPMGPGGKYNPQIEQGPHGVWIKGHHVSDMLLGLGWLSGTNHTHLNVFYQSKTPTPTPETVARKLKNARRIVNQCIRILEGTSTSQDEPED